MTDVDHSDPFHQHTLSTHPLSTPSQHNPLTRPLHTPTQYTLSTPPPPPLTPPINALSCGTTTINHLGIHEDDEEEILEALEMAGYLTSQQLEAILAGRTVASSFEYNSPTHNSNNNQNNHHNYNHSNNSNNNNHHSSSSSAPSSSSSGGGVSVYGTPSPTRRSGQQSNEHLDGKETPTQPNPTQPRLQRATLFINDHPFVTSTPL